MTPDNDDRVAERRAPPTAWQDPKTWMTLFGILLTICGLLLSVTIFIAGRMLDQMTKMNANVSALTLTTSNGFVGYDKDIKYLNIKLAEQSAFLRDQNAYNFNMNKVVTEMATTMRLRGLPVPNIPEPPKLGGQ